MTRHRWILLCGLGLACDVSSGDGAVDRTDDDNVSGDGGDAGNGPQMDAGAKDASAPYEDDDGGRDAGQPPPAAYTITNRVTGKLLTAKESGAIVQRSADGSAEQAWNLVTFAEHTMLVNVGSGLWLEAQDDVSEDAGVDPAIEQQELDHGESQQWAIIPSGPGCVNLMSRSTRLAADVQNGWLEDDTAIIQADPNGGLLQQWKISSNGEELRLPAHTITNRQSGKAMTGKDGVVVQSTADGSAAQRWNLVALDNFWLIANVAASEVLEVRGPNFETQGTELILGLYDGFTNKRWQLHESAGGHVQLVNRHSLMGAQVTDGATEDGATVFQWTLHDGENQQWKLEAVP